MRIGPLHAIVSSAAAIAVALLLATAVFAHGGESLFTAEPTVVAPGGGVAVTADLLTSGSVRLWLDGIDGTRIDIGPVDQTEGGHVQVVVQIPSDVRAGRWTLLAEADGVAIGSTTIEVAGAPIAQEAGGQGARDEDDPLLVPLPSGWQASRSGPPEAAPSAAVGATAEDLDVVPLASIAFALIALTLLVARTRTRGTSGGPSDSPR